MKKLLEENAGLQAAVERLKSDHISTASVLEERELDLYVLRSDFNRAVEHSWGLRERMIKAEEALEEHLRAQGPVRR